MASFKGLLANLKAKPKKKTHEIVSVDTCQVCGDPEDERVREKLVAEGPSIMRDQISARGVVMPDGVPSTIDPGSSTHQGCIALLFMVRSDLPFERMWRSWIRRAKDLGLRVLVYVHSHHLQRNGSSSQSWLAKRLISEHFDTPWGSLKLVDAAIALLERALETADNGMTRGSSPRPSHFLFASESCLPIVDPSVVLQDLFGRSSVALADTTRKSSTNSSDPSVALNDTTVSTETSRIATTTTTAAAAVSTASSSSNVCAGGDLGRKSWLRARNRPNNGYSAQLQFDKISEAVPKDARWKADQWILLSRPHASAITSLPRIVSVNVLSLLRHTRAPDELYFPTCLALLGELPTCEQALDLGALRHNHNAAVVVGLAAPPAAPSSNAPSASTSAASEETTQTPVAPNVAGRRLTYCDWDSGHSAKSPATLELTAAVVEAARQEGCLFARKFNPDAVTFAAWAELVLAVAPSSQDESEEEEESDNRENREEGGGGRCNVESGDQSRGGVSGRDHDSGGAPTWGRESWSQNHRHHPRDGQGREGRHGGGHRSEDYRRRGGSDEYVASSSGSRGSGGWPYDEGRYGNAGEYRGPEGNRGERQKRRRSRSRSR